MAEEVFIFLKKSLVIASLCIPLSSFSQAKILFDCTKAETAGNADWVIDADLHDMGWGSSGPYIGSNHSDPQQYPTPAQSTITASTGETYWEGSLSSWGIDMVRQGYEVETLPYTGQITYGNSSNGQDLANYKVFVIDEPNVRFSSVEKNALLAFVQNGGGLYMISDHNNSDRNNDGWDSPHIWLDLTTYLNNPFGITVDTVDISPTVTSLPNLPNDSLLHGPMGNVTGIVYHSGTSCHISTSANPSVVGDIFASGTTGSTGILVAHAYYGRGKVAFVGDSSPFDDGTGNPNASLYSSYATDLSGSHRKLIVNTTIWLAASDTTATINGVQNITSGEVRIYQMGTGQIRIVYPETNEDRSITIYNITGQLVLQQTAANYQSLETVHVDALASGIYFIKSANTVKKFIR